MPLPATKQDHVPFSRVPVPPPSGPSGTPPTPGPYQIIAVLAGDGRDEPTAAGEDANVALDVPSLIADHLNAAGDGEAQQALRGGQTVRRVQGHSVRLSAPIRVHRAAFDQSANRAAAGPAERKAYRVYPARIAAAETAA